MEVSSSPSPSSPQSQPRDSEMEAIDRMPISGDETAAAAAGGWDWGDLLDFTVDGDLSINWNEPLVQIQSQPNPPPLPPPPETAATEIGAEAAEAAKVRKRDPRMTCSNFLAGLIPCACPEVDQRLMELEEEEAGHDKKRLKTRRSGGGGGGARSAAGAAKCQVPSCGVDIKELKGYHRRHRVCLRCANAASVVIAGEDKRYCQQCGKFHVLPDFDEGKRSCRRKLERHNNRRRRKPVESKGAAGKESPGDIESEDASGDVEAGKDSSQTDSQMAQKETCVESGERVSPVHTAPDVNSDGVASLLDSGETQMDGGKYNTKHGVSVSYSNKSAYSSLCPTGRISFKLYDWNPAEFPRRLRQQIFQWLANMPIELEGYIRPGCIILTVFIAMPRFMWIKLSEDPISYVHNFVVAPGGMLSGRGNILVYLNNMVFHVRKGDSSVIKANVGERAPRLHYVHPICFEAGKPMEFVACGSDLLQPKLRFLVSFSGKYLGHNCCPASSHLRTESNCDGNFNHQLYQIRVPHTETNHFGPVFIEVENEAGLSNFIPVLIGDKETCSEIKVIQQRLDGSLVSDMPCFSSSGSPPNSCEASSLKQIAFSEVIVDIAWLLKNPESETFQQVLTTYQVQRIECLLNFLIAVESTTILEKILRNLKTSIDRIKSKHASNSVGDADLRLLQKYMDYAHQRRWHKLQTTVPSRNLLPNEDLVSEICSQNEAYSVVSFPLQDTEIMVDCKSEDLEGSVNDRRSETIPILYKERVSKANDNEKWPSEASCHALSTEVFRTRYGPVLRFRPSLCFIAVAAVCLGVCSVIFHPHKVSEIAISIRRCLLNQV